MLNKVARRFAVTIELTPTVPPRVRIPLKTQTSEFVLMPEDTIADLVNSIAEEDPTLDGVKCLDSQKEEIASDVSLQQLVKKSFWLQLGSTKIHVMPSIYNILQNGEDYLPKCDALGIPQTDAQQLSRFIQDLNSNVSGEFSQAELAAQIEKTYQSYNRFKTSDVSSLKQELELLEKKLEPLEKVQEEINVTAQKKTSTTLKAGLVILLGQWSGIAYGTFGPFGWDAMEPITYMITLSWTVVGFGFFSWNKEDYAMGGFRSILTKNYASQETDRVQLDLAQVELLKMRTEQIRKRILEIEALN